jgi:hypothetical protein
MLAVGSHADHCVAIDARLVTRVTQHWHGIAPLGYAAEPA